MIIIVELILSIFGFGLSVAFFPLDPYKVHCDYFDALKIIVTLISCAYFTGPVCSDIQLKIILGVFRKSFLDEIDIFISREKQIAFHNASGPLPISGRSQ